MDAFASILSAEMAKKKSVTKPADSTASEKSASKEDTPATSKYLRRADVEKARQEQYRAEQARLEAERTERALKKRKAEEEAAAERERVLEKRQRLREEKQRAAQEAEAARRAQETAAGANGDDDAKDSQSAADQMDVEAAIQKLRDLQEPITLFGETHAQRLRRIHRLTHGGGGSSPGTPRRTPSPPPLSGGELIVDPKNVASDPTYVRRQLLGWFQLVISEWQVMLAGRDEDLKESYQGKQATVAMTQAIENLQPLFRHLKKGDLDEEIFAKIVELVVEAQARRYVRANDVYLRLSIGNAAWPIGVTMVGIHERSAREKLHEKGKSAHIMSDEATRKYLQSIKRCLNFAQTRWPPEDPMQIMG
ncbi:Pre-mRNA-splicing factor [Drechslerella dactyloides]|uniref:Pre-mRNA-splicing factor 18 n=1 Tax=Drechslerella dactyloides TaxID=74499 RepID=A0AAD6NEL4_DREDA|nr:Pre-mRNA-splicing factor [Drechslerella dactyloides]